MKKVVLKILDFGLKFDQKIEFLVEADLLFNCLYLSIGYNTSTKVSNIPYPAKFATPEKTNNSKNPLDLRILQGKFNHINIQKISSKYLFI